MAVHIDSTSLHTTLTQIKIYDQKGTGHNQVSKTDLTVLPWRYGRSKNTFISMLRHSKLWWLTSWLVLNFNQKWILGVITIWCCKKNWSILLWSVINGWDVAREHLTDRPYVSIALETARLCAKNNKKRNGKHLYKSLICAIFSKQQYFKVFFSEVKSRIFHLFSFPFTPPYSLYLYNNYYYYCKMNLQF